jgi:hypothetical protein
MAALSLISDTMGCCLAHSVALSIYFGSGLNLNNRFNPLALFLNQLNQKPLIL